MGFWKKTKATYIAKASLAFAFITTSPAHALTVNFASDSSVASEDSRDRIYIDVVADSEADENIEIPVRITGSADPRDDYRINYDDEIRIRRNDDTAQFQVRMRDDRDFEGLEDFTIELLPAPGVEIGPNNKHHFTIKDDEKAPPYLSILDEGVRVDEEEKELVFRVGLSEVNEDDNVRFEVALSGTAEERDDYRIKRDRIRINRGDLEAEIVIEIEDDEDIEGEETIVLTLTEIEYAQAGEKTEIVISINPSDTPMPDTALSNECFDGTSSKSRMSYSYCVSRTEGSQNKDVLYYFHGAFGSKEDWYDHGSANGELRRQLRMHWQEQGWEAPTVVAISLGTLWMLNEQPDEDGGEPTYKPMVEEIIPEVESKVLGGADLEGRRLLMGVSMGGFNSISLFLKNPEMWDKAIFIAPMMPLCNPFLPEDYIWACVAADPYKKNAYLAKIAHDLARKFFPIPWEWTAQKPTTLVKELSGPGLPEFLLTSGTIDDFGFYTRNLEFAETAQSTSSPIQWESTDMEHGGFDPAVLGNFFMK